MAKAQTAKQWNSFVRGIVTESNPLTFPENASIDEDNFVLNRDGSRNRRLGMDFEASAVLNTESTSNFEDKAITTGIWSNAGNVGTYTFGVVQVGATLYFHDLNASVPSTQKSFTVDLTTYSTGYNPNFGSEPVSVTSGNGVLFVVSKDTEPFYIEYNTSTDTITVTQVNIKIRDFAGLDDGLDVDERPTTLSEEHEYNLKNQGWGLDVPLSSGTIISLIPYTFTELGEYPSNADIWHIAKDSVNQYVPLNLDRIGIGNTPAPKGAFILNPFNRNYNTLAGTTTITSDIEKHRPEAVAFYAGRVFYAGVQSSPASGNLKLNGEVYFSRILTDIRYAGQCYQEADPTSEYLSDIVDYDGGVIKIPEMGRCLSMVPVGQDLVVVADNGIWRISGGSGAFVSTDYAVNKITKVGAISKGTIIAIEDTIVYWAVGGIYVVASDQVSGVLKATNITEQTIQTLYNNIPSIAKLYATGSYDPVSKKVTWLYNDMDSYDGVTYRNRYNRELVFDLVLQSFYTNTISSLETNSPYVADYIVTPDTQSSTVQYTLVDSSGDIVVDGTGDTVVIEDVIASAGKTSTKYLTEVYVDATTTKYTFSEYINASFVDWFSADDTGVDYSSYLVTGYELFGDIMRNKEAYYLVMHFNKTEEDIVAAGGLFLPDKPSSCMVQTRWGWSDSASSGHWSTPRQAYKHNRPWVPAGSGAFDNGYKVITTKNRVRGSGKALSLYLYSETGKDMHILGWGLTASGGTIV